jgi:hypothetical protein
VSNGKGDKPRKRQISNEEWDFRNDFMSGKIVMTNAKFKAVIKGIRERTGKP